MVQRTRTIKILIFTTHFYPYIGGLENYILQIASRLIKQNIKVDILTFNDKNLNDFEKYKGINIYRIPCWNVLGPVYSIPLMNKKTKLVLEKLSKKKYDFVNTHTRFFTSSWLGMKFAKKNNIKLIHTEHGNTFVKHPNPIIEFLAFLYDLTIGKKVLKSAWKIAGVSKSCCNFAKKMGGKSCTVVYNCVDTSLFKKKKTRLKEELNIPKKTKVITFVGRLIQAKGVQELIQALEKVKGIKLLVVGNGPYLNKLKILAKEKNVDSLFLTSKKREDIVDILNITDIFVNPSYSEGLPTSVLEAGAVGVPIIATDVGGTREIIDNRKNGVLIKPKNATQLRKNIILLLKNKKIRKSFSKNITKKVKDKFRWESSVEKMLKLMRKK